VAVLVIAVGSFLFFGMNEEDEEATTQPTSSEQNQTPTDAEADATQNIVEIAASNDDFTTLVAAIQAADLAETLSGEGLKKMGKVDKETGVLVSGSTIGITQFSVVTKRNDSTTKKP
jgi:hypothetical protein